MQIKSIAYAFGNGIFGQLGVGSNRNHSNPIKVKLENADGISAGQNHSLFISSDRVYATGDNTSGQIGVGNGKKYYLEPQL